MKKPAVCLVGAGSMGGALLKGWLAANTINVIRSSVIDPDPSDDIAEICHQNKIATSLGDTPDIFVFAVKPQVAGKVLAKYQQFSRDAVCVSIMAGFSIASMNKALGGAKRIVRAMPNLPASIRAGVSGLYGTEAVSKNERRIVSSLFEAVGAAVWVDDEDQIDVVTAVSGSGPAYFFLMAEAMAKAGAVLGLPDAVADQLARETLAGAGALVAASATPIGEMRKAVTSPGGTTDAALKAFQQDDAFSNLVKSAINAAAKRAGELTE